MVVFDQLDRKVTLNGKPERVISLVPSQTELLHYFGLEDEVIGITKFCVHPSDWFTTKTKVGGTKKVKFSLIAHLSPDLIIGNKEENTPEDVSELEKIAPVWLSDINTVKDSYNMILQLGNIFNCEQKAKTLVAKTKENLASLRGHFKGKSVLYFIWNNPLMVVGNQTFINDLLTQIGFKNAAGNFSRYPKLTENELRELNPDFVLLSSEPFPFKEKHKTEFQSIFKASRVKVVDGEVFSWYGPRILQLLPYLRKEMAI